MGVFNNVEGRLTRVPGYRRLESAGFMGALLVQTVRAATTPPFKWRRDFVDQCELTIRRCTFPLMISIAFFAVGIIVTIIVGLLGALGTIDRNGAGQAIGWFREVAYWVTGMIFAGAVGSAVTADLGARKIREELDAMSVLGVDQVRTLVVPRVLALMVVAPVLGVIAAAEAMTLMYALGPMLAPNATYQGFLTAAHATANTGDVISFLLRCTITGLFVGIVCCAKGLTAKGGAEGVGRAVNEAVLITFLGLWILNGLWNAAFLPTFPDVTVLRG